MGKLESLAQTTYLRSHVSGELDIDLPLKHNIPNPTHRRQLETETTPLPSSPDDFPYPLHQICLAYSLLTLEVNNPRHQKQNQFHITSKNIFLFTNYLSKNQIQEYLNCVCLGKVTFIQFNMAKLLNGKHTTISAGNNKLLICLDLSCCSEPPFNEGTGETSSWSWKQYLTLWYGFLTKLN